MPVHCYVTFTLLDILSILLLWDLRVVGNRFVGHHVAVDVVCLCLLYLVCRIHLRAVCFRNRCNHWAELQKSNRGKKICMYKYGGSSGKVTNDESLKGCERKSGNDAQEQGECCSRTCSIVSQSSSVNTDGDRIPTRTTA